MELLLAIVVTSAVIFFGALISMGNERQRKAIDSLREQVVLWAMQDLKIKRENLSKEIRVEDPLAWLNKVAVRACGWELNLQVIEHLNDPRILFCSGNANNEIIVTPLSPREVRILQKVKRNRLSKHDVKKSISRLSGNMISFECSVLNCGIAFDLELPLAWKGLTGENIGMVERLWIFVQAGGAK